MDWNDGGDAESLLRSRGIDVDGVAKTYRIDLAPFPGDDQIADVVANPGKDPTARRSRMGAKPVQQALCVTLEMHGREFDFERISAGKGLG